MAKRDGALSTAGRGDWRTETLGAYAGTALREAIVCLVVNINTCRRPVVVFFLLIILRLSPSPPWSPSVPYTSEYENSPWLIRGSIRESKIFQNTAV
jgi:hypothetical protein